MSYRPVDQLDAEADAETDHEAEAKTETGEKGDQTPSQDPSSRRKSDGVDCTDDSSSMLTRPRGRKSRIVNSILCGAFPWLVNIILVVLFFITRLQESSLKGPEVCDLPKSDLVHTIAQDYVEHRVETVYDGFDMRNPTSPYQGWPNDEQDKLWDKFDSAMFRINKSEAEKLPHLSIQVAINEYKDQYLVGVTFTHALHCLNTLRRTVYPKRYNTSFLDEDGNVVHNLWWHTDHCIEIIRRYITCHADTTAFTYEWAEDAQILVHPGTVHLCRNFDHLMEWFDEYLVHPSIRKHVEDGKIVDYGGRPMGKAWDEIEVKAPEGWAYTEEDM